MEYSLNIGPPTAPPLSSGKPKLRQDVKLRLASKNGIRSNHHMSNSCDSSPAYFTMNGVSTQMGDGSHRRTSSHGTVLSSSSNVSTHSLSLPPFMSTRPTFGSTNSGRLVMQETALNAVNSNASNALGAMHCPSARFLFEPPTPINNTPSVRYLLRKSEMKTILFQQGIDALALQQVEEMDENAEEGGDVVDDGKDRESSYASAASDIGRTFVGSHSRSRPSSSNHSVASIQSVGSRRTTSNSRRTTSHSRHSLRLSQSVASQGSKSEVEWMDERSRTMNDMDSLVPVPMTRSRTMNTLLLPQSLPPPPPSLSVSSLPIRSASPLGNVSQSEGNGPKYKEPTLAHNQRRMVYSPPLFRLNPLFPDYDKLKEAPSEKIQLVGIRFVDESVQQRHEVDQSQSVRSSRIPRIEESKSSDDGTLNEATEPDEKERKHAAKQRENEDWQIMGDLLFSIRHSLISRKRIAEEEAVLEGRSRRKRKSHLDVMRNEWNSFIFEEYGADLFAELRCKWLKSELLSDCYVKKLFGEKDASVPVEQLDINKSCKFYWRRLNTNSKSGQIFFQSVNGEYIMKSMPHSEALFFRKSFLRDYHEHMLLQPDSLLMHIMGCYQIQYKTGHRAMNLASNNEYNSKRKQDVEKGVYVIVMKSILFCGACCLFVLPHPLPLLLLFICVLTATDPRRTAQKWSPRSKCTASTT